jgi:2-dehydropantoate 2-reductase
VNERITVVGAGAIGGFVGARLLDAGHDVSFVDAEPAHVAAVRADGLRVRGRADLHVHAPICTPDELDGPLTTVLLAVKARHTLAAVDRIAPLLAADGYVVSLQNGLEEYKIAAAVGRDRTVGAFLTFGGYYVGPGEIVYGGDGSFRVGELDGARTERLDRLERLLADAHPVEATGRIFGFLWGKTALEAFYFASALADADVVEVLSRVDVLPALGLLVAEVVRVAEAEGVTCEPVDGFDPNAFGRGEEAERESWDAQRRYWDGHVAVRTGIWRDLAVHRRPTEVDQILGPVVAAADRHGLDVPHLRRLVGLVHAVESGERPLGREALLCV